MSRREDIVPLRREQLSLPLLSGVMFHHAMQEDRAINIQRGNFDVQSFLCGKVPCRFGYHADNADVYVTRTFVESEG